MDRLCLKTLRIFPVSSPSLDHDSVPPTFGSHARAACNENALWLSPDPSSRKIYRFDINTQQWEKMPLATRTGAGSAKGPLVIIREAVYAVESKSGVVRFQYLAGGINEEDQLSKFDSIEGYSGQVCSYTVKICSHTTPIGELTFSLRGQPAHPHGALRYSICDNKWTTLPLGPGATAHYACR